MFTGAIISTNSKFGDGEGPIVYTVVNCFGHENQISECLKSEFPYFYCNRQYTIGLHCYDG